MYARFALLMPLMIAFPANAGTLSTVVVSYSDVNLVSAHGHATLERRLEAAIEKVCGHGGSRDLAIRAASKKCEMAARDEARLKMQVAVQRATSTNKLAAAGSSPRS